MVNFVKVTWSTIELFFPRSVQLFKNTKILNKINNAYFHFFKWHWISLNNYHNNKISNESICMRFHSFILCGDNQEIDVNLESHWLLSLAQIIWIAIKVKTNLFCLLSICMNDNKRHISLHSIRLLNIYWIRSRDPSTHTYHSGEHLWALIATPLMNSTECLSSDLSLNFLQFILNVRHIW